MRGVLKKKCLYQKYEAKIEKYLYKKTQLTRELLKNKFFRRKNVSKFSSFISKMM